MKLYLGRAKGLLPARAELPSAGPTVAPLPGPEPRAQDKTLGLIATATPPSDPFPISQKKAWALTLGIPQQFHSRVPASHLGELHKIRRLRPELLKLSDAQLSQRFQAIGLRLQKGEPPTRFLGEALAIAREVSRRTLKKEPYEVQLLGALALATGHVAQLKTGEGKTLTGALAAAFQALHKKGVHVVTTNAYLAERDAVELAPFYAGLGLTVGVTKSMGQSYDEKRVAYAQDITYGHCATLAFDWLEDQVWWRRDWRVQRELAFAIVDEADDVLLDTAQQPLVLCGAPESTELPAAKREELRMANEIIQAIDPERHLSLYFEREKQRPALNAAGFDALERAIAEQLGVNPDQVWSAQHNSLLYQVHKALEARYSVVLGKDFIQDQEQLTLVSSTGHPAPGSRLRHGLMNAVLTARGQAPEPELSVIGMISYQSYYNMYGKLAGITGTSRGAKEELRDIYRLSVIEIPTHKPIARVDEPDRCFPHPGPRTLAAVADVLTAHEKGTPVLVSTISVNASKHFGRRLADPLLTLVDVAVSSRPMFMAVAGLITGGDRLKRELEDALGASPEALAPRLRALMAEDPASFARVANLLEDLGLPARKIVAHAAGVPHRVLNAETHQEEAEIYAQAGQLGAVTVATQMAGRGVDIPVSPEALLQGGLRIIGVEHKTNRRQDDQARGRSGRQGQVGSSVFYVSPADEVFSYLPAHKLRQLCAMLPADRIEPPSPALAKAWQAAVEGAQRRAELVNEIDRRRNVKLDGVIELQRRFLRKVREEILDEPNLVDHVRRWVHDDLERDLNAPGPVDRGQAIGRYLALLGVEAPELAQPHTPLPLVHARVAEEIDRRITATKLARNEDDVAFNQYLRDMILYNLDQAWVLHLQNQEQNKGTAYLAAYADRDPYLEHGKNASDAFRAMEQEVRETVVGRFLHHLSSHSTTNQ